MRGTDWRTDRVRDADEVVRWLPAISVSRKRTWSGRTEDGPWVVGEPGLHVLRVGSPAGVIALLPLLERTMPQVAAELGVVSLVEHDLGFDRVLDAALGFGGSGHWASCAVAWFDAGFPAAGHREGLRLVTSDKSVPQRARQTAARILTRTIDA